MSRPSLDQARAALRAAFGYDDFRAGQTTAIQSVLEGRDTLVVLPTGGGKSVCYQIPAVVLPGLTVVVSPLISLMKDQVDGLCARGIPAACVNSALSSRELSHALAKVACGELKLMYVAPERFDSGPMAQRLARAGVSLLAVDEAHCISQWGHDFRPSYLRLSQARAVLGSPPVVALTATATPEVRQDICTQLALIRPRTVITGFDRTNLSYHVLHARDESGKDELLATILRGRNGIAVVYASTRRSVDRLAQLLEQRGFRAGAYHAGLDDARRRSVQDAFMNESIQVIVATNSFGMGIDKPNVRTVVHHSMPGTLEAYYQEAGRAGRDGLESEVFLLYARNDRKTHEFFISGSCPSRETIERVYAGLRRLAGAGAPISASLEELSGLLGAKLAPREVERALRILADAGAVVMGAGSASHAFVRLLAAPSRIRRELGSQYERELAFLRALWRVAGERLLGGAVMDLNELPPGLAASAGAREMLETLQGRQFLIWDRVGAGPRLTKPGAELSTFALDWAMLERRRAAELAKLDAVERYARTSRCRRAFVLRYFGDPAARDGCDACDNCLTSRLRILSASRWKTRSISPTST